MELTDHPNWLPLESCICGLCFECPDGYHVRDDDDEGGCSCTADCVFEEKPEDDECASCGYELVDERCVNQLCIQYRTHPEESE